MNETPLCTTLPGLMGDVLAIHDTMTNEQVLEVRERVLFAKQRIKEIEKTLDEGLLDWMRANGDLVINEEKKLYIGKDKRTKCNDPAATLEGLLEATGGDFGAVCDCLSSGAFKHGACRKPLGDDWNKYFTVEEIDKVKVKEADARFGPRNSKKQLTAQEG